jgi:hypothetical protein
VLSSSFGRLLGSHVPYFNVYTVLMRTDGENQRSPYFYKPFSDPFLALANVRVIASTISVSNTRLLDNIQDGRHRLIGHNRALEGGLILCRQCQL